MQVEFKAGEEVTIKPRPKKVKGWWWSTALPGSATGLGPVGLSPEGESWKTRFEKGTQEFRVRLWNRATGLRVEKVFCFVVTE